MHLPDCIFCRIASGEIPAQIVARSDHAVAFRDLSPQAPTHILVIPTAHLASAAEATGEAGAALLGEVMALGVRVAAELGLAEGGYRFVMNTGREGGQTVHHLHLHLLGGRQMHWPPG
ncbi:MAG: HIT domain-containing protein [Gemmatimonadetes bacterium]|nr:HIT domain-containing protein [Gemmatimonadota bacterium]